MATNIQQFQSAFRGGVRPNLFQASISSVDGALPGFEFHCKGTSIPASTIGNIPVPYHGRQLMVPGDRVYADWTVTVFNDVNMTIRRGFEDWMEQIQSYNENTSSLAEGFPYGQGEVTQLDRRGSPIRSYTFGGVYPTECAAIDLAWDSNDAVEEYSVTLAVNMWAPTGHGSTQTTSAGGRNMNKSGVSAGANLKFDKSGASGNVFGAFKNDSGLTGTLNQRFGSGNVDHA